MFPFNMPRNVNKKTPIGHEIGNKTIKRCMCRKVLTIEHHQIDLMQQTVTKTTTQNGKTENVCQLCCLSIIFNEL